MVFKGCRRCGGDMYTEDDLGETELVCLQCGSRRLLASNLSRELGADVARHVRRLMSRGSARAA